MSEHLYDPDEGGEHSIGSIAARHLDWIEGDRGGVKADLSKVDLTRTRRDIHNVFDDAPRDVVAVLTALRSGRIDGSCYRDPDSGCGCLIGTIAMARQLDCTRLRNSSFPIQLDSFRLAEAFFSGITPDDTPATSEFSRYAELWCVEWLAEHPYVRCFGPPVTP